MTQQHDGEAIRRDYCAGVLSLQKVAHKHGIAKTTLIDMANKHHWARQKTPTNTADRPANGRVVGRKNGRTVGASNDGACSDAATPENNTKAPKTKRNSRAVGRGGNPNPANQFSTQNRASLKHGGYARRLLVSDANLEDAAALTLEDELLRVRAVNLETAEAIGRWKTQLLDAKGEERDRLLANIEGAHKAMDRNASRIGILEAGLMQGRKAEADIQQKLAARDKTLFELQRDRALAPLESQRRELVNKKIQTEIDRADPASKDNVVVIHNALQIPGAIQ